VHGVKQRSHEAVAVGAEEDGVALMSRKRRMKKQQLVDARAAQQRAPATVGQLLARLGR
jgi:hypothetical protein